MSLGSDDKVSVMTTLGFRDTNMCVFHVFDGLYMRVYFVIQMTTSVPWISAPSLLTVKTPLGPSSATVKTASVRLAPPRAKVRLGLYSEH